MAILQQYFFQICVLSLCGVFSTVYGKSLKYSAPGLSSDDNNPTNLFEAKHEEIGDRPVEYDDEDYREPANEKPYYYDPNYQQPLEAQIDDKQSHLIQSIDDTENKVLDTNNVRNLDPSNFLSENNVGSPSLVEASVNESDMTIKNSVPTPAQSGKLNPHIALLSLKTLSDVTKRGVMKNTTEKNLVNESGKTEKPPKRVLSHLSEAISSRGTMAAGTLNREMSMTQNDEHLVDNRLNHTVPISKISKVEERIEQPEPQSGSATAQPLGDATSGNGSDPELNSNKPSEIVNSSTNYDKRPSVKSGGKYFEVNTKANISLNSSSQIIADSPSIPIDASETTNASKGGGEAQQREDGINNHTDSLAPDKKGTVSQQGTSKATSLATASSKVAAKFQTSKPPLSQSTGESYDSSLSTTSTRPTHRSTSNQKETSIKSDDSDVSIDQPPASNRDGGFKSQQPYQGQFAEEGLPMVHSTPINDQDSHFFAYFASLLITAALGYVVYHNRNKILALVLEGRRGRGSSGSRRGSSAGSIGRRKGRGGGGGGAKYQPLHTSLDQVMNSNGTENGGDSGLDRVY